MRERDKSYEKKDDSYKILLTKDGHKNKLVIFTMSGAVKDKN